MPENGPGRGSQLLSRREFLLGLPRRFREEVESADINHEKAAPWLFEKCGELAVLVALILVGKKSSELNISRYAIKSESQLAASKEFKTMQVEVSQLWNIIYDVLESVITLESTWRSDFHKSRTVATTSVDSDGKITTEYHTQYYWDEPDGANGFNNTLSRWSSLLGHINRQLANLTHDSNKAFDVAHGPNTLIFQGESSSPQAWPFAIAGLSFIFYEEVLRLISESSGQIDVFDDNVKVTRRTVLKMISAGATYIGVNQLLKRLNTANANVLNEIKQEVVTDVFQQMKVSESENFARCFGLTPEQLLALLNEIEQEMQAKSFLLEQKKLFGSYVLSDSTKNAFINLVEQEGRSIADLTAYFGGDVRQPEVPDALDTLSRNAWATNKILKITNRANLSQKLSGALPSLFTFGFLAGLGYLIEKDWKNFLK